MGWAQTVQPPVRKKTVLLLTSEKTAIKEIEYYWVGWNFVEKRDVYRPKNGRDTLLVYMGKNKEGLEMYDAIARKGTPGPPPDPFLLSQAQTKLAQSLQASMSEHDALMNYYKCKIKLLHQFPLIYCDKDIYPIEKRIDERYIDNQWKFYQTNQADALRALANLFDISPGGAPTYEEKYIMYDYLKKINVIGFEKAGKKYDFAVVAWHGENENRQPHHIIGKISPNGVVETSSKKETSLPECK
jgi:hypothetical protein